MNKEYYKNWAKNWREIAFLILCDLEQSTEKQKRISSQSCLRKSENTNI